MNVLDHLESFRPMLLARAWALYKADKWPKEIEPEEVVAETLQRACAAADSFHAETIGQLTKWMWQIFRSTLGDLLDRYNAKKRRTDRTRSLEEFFSDSDSRVDFLLPSKSRTASSIVGGQEEIDKLFSKLALLPQASQDVLIDRYIKCRTIRQMAEELGISDNAVGARLLRAREKLASLMGDS